MWETINLVWKYIGRLLEEVAFELGREGILWTEDEGPDIAV